MSGMAVNSKQSGKTGSLKSVGLVLGVAIFILMLLLSTSQDFMSEQAWRTAAVALLMAIWWSTEAVPVPMTALLPIVCFPLLGILSMKDAVGAYAHPTVYLFLGAFILALAVEKSGLHKRLALSILARTGTEGRRLIGGFMLTSAVLSMWISNTATTMMLLPIAVSVIAVVVQNVPTLTEVNESRFKIAMLLGLAYAASIGGMTTLIGTPPNALLAAFLEQNYGFEIGFVDWLIVGVPVAVIALPVAWIVLTRYVYPVNVPESEGTYRHLQDLRAALGSMSPAQKRVALVFSVVVAGWILRRPIASMLGLEGLSDAGIVVAAAIVLFILPAGKASGPKLLSWSDTEKLPWGVLVLFGGGLSLASGISSSGLALWLGESVGSLSVYGVFVLILAAVTLVVFLTEMTSNLATTATLLPVVGAMALQAGVSPLLLCIPVTLAASFAFMLPVATPPNAIVFSSGMLTIPQMVKAGLWLNLFGIVLLVVVGMWWAPAVFQSAG